jgi:hypothetical protein
LRSSSSAERIRDLCHSIDDASVRCPTQKPEIFLPYLFRHRSLCLGVHQQIRRVISSQPLPQRSGVADVYQSWIDGVFLTLDIPPTFRSNWCFSSRGRGVLGPGALALNFPGWRKIHCLSHNKRVLAVRNGVGERLLTSLTLPTTVERNAAFLFEEFWATTTRRPSAARRCSCRGGGDGEGGGGGWGGNSWRK